MSIRQIRAILFILLSECNAFQCGQSEYEECDEGHKDMSSLLQSKVLTTLLTSANGASNNDLDQLDVKLVMTKGKERHRAKKTKKNKTKKKKSTTTMVKKETCAKVANEASLCNYFGDAHQLMEQETSSAFKGWNGTHPTMKIAYTVAPMQTRHGLGLFTQQEVKSGEKVYCDIEDWWVKVLDDDIPIVGSLASFSKDVVVRALDWCDKDFLCNEEQGIGIICQLDDGRFFNHADNPTLLECEDDDDCLCASRNLNVGDEITENYLLDVLEGGRTDRLTEAYEKSSNLSFLATCNNAMPKVVHEKEDSLKANQHDRESVEFEGQRSNAIMKQQGAEMCAEVADATSLCKYFDDARQLMHEETSPSFEGWNGRHPTVKIAYRVASMRDEKGLGLFTLQDVKAREVVYCNSRDWWVKVLDDNAHIIGSLASFSKKVVDRALRWCAKDLFCNENQKHPGIICRLDDGRFLNHAENPTLMKCESEGHDDCLCASRDLQTGEEITENYLKDMLITGRVNRILQGYVANSDEEFLSVCTKLLPKLIEESAPEARHHASEFLNDSVLHQKISQHQKLDYLSTMSFAGLATTYTTYIYSALPSLALIQWTLMLLIYVFGYAFSVVLGEVMLYQPGVLRSRQETQTFVWPLVRFKFLLGMLIGVIDFLWYHTLTYLFYVMYGNASRASIMATIANCVMCDSLFWLAMDLFCVFAEGYHFINWDAGVLDVDSDYMDLLCFRLIQMPLSVLLWTSCFYFGHWSLRPVLVMILLFVEDKFASQLKALPSINCGDVYLAHCESESVGCIYEKGRSIDVLSFDDERFLRINQRHVHLDACAAEAMVHISLLGLGSRSKRVLLLGDGCGLYAEHALKHADVERLLVLEPYPATASFVRKECLGLAGNGPNALDTDSRAEVREVSFPLTDSLSQVVTTEGPFDFIVLSPLIDDADYQTAVSAVAASIKAGGMIALQSELLMHYGPLPHIKSIVGCMNWCCSLNAVGSASSTCGLSSIWLLTGTGEAAPHFDTKYIASKLPKGLMSLCGEADVKSALCQPPMINDFLALEGMSRSGYFFQQHIKEEGTRPGSPWEDPTLHLTTAPMLCNVETPFQTVQIVETAKHGLALFTSNALQSAASDEFIYHEALVHVPCVIHGKVRRVLIGGAGEGATLRELLRHESVEEIVSVDIDQLAVECYQKHLFQWHRDLWAHPKVKLVYNDINEVLQQYEGYFDLLILDLTDPTPTGPSAHLFTKEFYQRCRSCLRAGGLMAMQSGECSPTRMVPSSIRATLHEVFHSSAFYALDIPSFLYPWLVSLAFTKPLDCIPRDLQKRVSKIHDASPSDPGPMRFYCVATHEALFNGHRHRSLQRSLERFAPVIREGQLRLVGNSRLWDKENSQTDCGATSMPEMMAAFQADRVVHCGTQVAIDLRQHLDVEQLRLVYHFFQGARLRKAGFSDFLSDVIDSKTLVVAEVNSTGEVQGALVVEPLALAGSVYVSAWQINHKNKVAQPLLHQLTAAEIRGEIDRASALPNNVSAPWLPFCLPATSQVDVMETFRRRCLFNSNLESCVVEYIWELLKADEMPCRAAGHEPLISLACARVGTHEVLADARKVAAPWLFPPGGRMGFISAQALVVDAEQVPVIRNKKFLMRFHLKILLISMWWWETEEPLFLCYPGFKQILAQLDSFPEDHHFELLPMDSLLLDSLVANVLSLPYTLWRNLPGPSQIPGLRT